MNTFILDLCSAWQHQRIEGVVSFVGEDASGQFGILPGHAPLAAVLVFGLARFRRAGEDTWRYLALPGGTLHFSGGRLSLSTRDYLLTAQAREAGQALEEKFLRARRRNIRLRDNLDQLEQAIFRRLWQMGKS